MTPIETREVVQCPAPQWRSRALIAVLTFTLTAFCGCQRAWWQGFLDPTQVGRFEKKPRKQELRRTLGVLIDEPEGITGATEPTPDDLVVTYEESKLAPGDAVEISIFELLQSNQDFRVERRINEVGYLSLPEVGHIRVAGLTPRELELTLIDKIVELGTLVDPEINVRVLQSQSQRYTIIGATNRAGTYGIPRPQFRLLDAVGDAGGVPPTIKTIYVIRRSEPEFHISEEQERLFKKASTERPDDPSRPTPYYEQPLDIDSGLDDILAPMPIEPRQGNGGDATDGNGDEIPEIVPLLPPPSTIPDSDPESMMPDDDEPVGMTPASSNASQIPPDDDLEALLNPDGAGNRNVFDPNSDDFRPVRPVTTGPATTQSGDENNPWFADPERMPASSQTPGSLKDATAEVDWDQLAAPEIATRIIAIPVEPLINGDPRYNIVIHANDIVNVEQGPVGEFFVMGNVLRPGAYTLTGRDIGVREALAAAGGFGPLAFPSNAELIRRGTADEEEIIPLDLDAIFAAESENLYIRPNDVLNVGTNPVMPFLATIRNAFRVSYGFGFVYDRNFADIDSYSGQQNPTDRRRQERLQQGFPLGF